MEMAARLSRKYLLELATGSALYLAKIKGRIIGLYCGLISGSAAIFIFDLIKENT